MINLVFAHLKFCAPAKCLTYQSLNVGSLSKEGENDWVGT